MHKKDRKVRKKQKGQSLIIYIQLKSPSPPLTKEGAVDLHLKVGAMKGLCMFQAFFILRCQSLPDDR